MNDKKQVQFDEITTLKEHMKLVLTYVRNLEGKLDKMEVDQNKMGDNISVITNKLLEKINNENKILKDDIKILLTYLRELENKNESSDSIEKIENKIKEMNDNNDIVIQAIEHNKKYVDSLTKNLKKVADFIKESSTVKLYKKLENELEKIRYEYSNLNTYNETDISNNIASNLLPTDKIKFNRFYEDLRQLKRNHYDILNSLKTSNETSSYLFKDNEKVKNKFNKMEPRFNTLLNMNNILRNQNSKMENNFRTLLMYVKSLENKVNELSLNKIKEDVENEISNKISTTPLDIKSKKTEVINDGNITLEIKEI